MILAAYRDTGYNIVLLLHILSVVVAFAPAVVHPLTLERLRARGTDVAPVTAIAADNGRKVYLPALVLAGAFGILLVVLAGNVIGFDQFWISWAFLVWIVIAGVVTGLILPNERRVAEGDADAHQKVALGGQAVSLLFLAMLYLMIFKPGA